VAVEDKLAPLFKPISSLYGMGPALAKSVERLVGGPLVRNCLFHLPISVVHRQEVSQLKQDLLGETVTFKALVMKHQGKGFAGAHQPYRVHCKIGNTMISLVFFNARKQFLMQQLPENQVCVISGKLEMFRGQWQMTHPDYMGPLETLRDWVGFMPTYPLTQGVAYKTLKKAMYWVLRSVPPLPEWLSRQTVKWHPDWRSWHDSIVKAHHPETEADLLPTTPHRLRLAYDELLANQIGLRLFRYYSRLQKGKAKHAEGTLLSQAYDHLPFELTEDQGTALKAIIHDLTSPHCMNRLLQGDVGSGKTIVAFLAALVAIESGYQCAFMAPTEILARQHYASLKDLAESIGIHLALLTGKDTAAYKKKVAHDLASGQIHLILGTHALIQDELTYKDLGFVIIDEQHRFGVDQRLKLMQKGHDVDCLSMTATPIPRTLMLAAYGDLDSSQLRQKPPGRKEIQTKTVSLSRLEEVIEAVKRAVSTGEKVYWVCPLVEESETLDLAAAEERFKTLEALLPGHVGLIHGRLKSKEKDAIMKQFVEGEFKVLIATTVIEVGVNVLDATIMIIEHAERFGLSQLHQLRGRVGRGVKEGTCILLYDSTLSEGGTARLNIMRQTTDGFLIAEEDWKIRGGGEVLGFKQSGLPDYKFVDWANHQPLLKEAVLEAEHLISNDPTLSTTPQGQAARLLLKLFDKDQILVGRN
jgi:ATP-dependent DNA helicase RecG